MPGTRDVAAESATSAHRDRTADSANGPSHPVPGRYLDITCSVAQRGSCCRRITAIEIFACRVFDQDWNEVAYRPTVEHVVALVHDGLNFLCLELWEPLLEPAGDPGYRLGFAAGLVSAASRTHDDLHAPCGRLCSLRGLHGPMTR